MAQRDRILVVGAGFVGLATATFFADKRCAVTVLEQNRLLVDSLRQGKLHFKEPTLAKHFKKAANQGRLRIEYPGKRQYQECDLIFIAIDSVDPTNNWQMKMAAFERLARWIGTPARRNKAMVVLRSTNILGFANKFRQMLDAEENGNQVQVAVSPEFLREGLAYEDTAQPWRVIVGADSASSARRLTRFYRSIYSKKVPIVETDMKSAELIKLGSNLYLSHRLAFVHEVAEYAKASGLETAPILSAIGQDPRIGTDYFSPGLGFGGSCLPKDCHLMNARQLGERFQFQTAETALDVNRRVITGCIDSLKTNLETVKNRRIAILGAAFKPETDDTRHSPALELAGALRRRGVRISIFEPLLAGTNRIVDGSFDLSENVMAAVKGAHAIVVGTAHRQFCRLVPSSLAGLVKKRLILDRFDHLPKDSWNKAGFEFI